jgi:hypothetical protein
VTIFVTPLFVRSVKKLHRNAKQDLDSALGVLQGNPLLGESKIGDLSGVRVYKFSMVGQLTLLAYQYDELTPSITCLSLGSHENFYRDLKRKR